MITELRFAVGVRLPLGRGQLTDGGLRGWLDKAQTECWEAADVAPADANVSASW